jgi:PhzF family phenazine biosynthesis protein
MPERSCRLFQVDAFTRARFRGNPASVVLDADALSDEEMQMIARELASPETAFVLEAESSDNDLRVRFFTPRHEVPFVAHATIAAQYVRARQEGFSTGALRQETGAGTVAIEVFEADGDLRVAIESSPPSLGPVIPDHHRSQVLDALGISSPNLHKRCPLQIMAKGSTRLLIGVRSIEQLGQLKPDFDRLAKLTPHVGAEGFFVFAIDEAAEAFATESRMFVPAIGIPEDPVSGNAHGMLGTYLITHGLLETPNGELRFTGRQGRFVDRPGRVEVEIESAGRVAQSVRVSGDAVIVYEAELPL